MFLDMSGKGLKGFWEATQEDSALRQKLEGVNDPDKIAGIAREAGFSITAEEIKKAQSEISDEQLEAVAGGITYPSYPSYQDW